MSAGSIITLPGGDIRFRAALSAAVRDLGGRIFEIDLPPVFVAPISILICARIHELEPTGPLVVVAPASSAAYLPALALAQRTAHRRVAAYYLIDPLTDPTGPEWPDAPVYLAQQNSVAASKLPELRGWQAFNFNAIDELASALVASTNI
ncbi:MAG: hypothetical protein O2943_06665 [Actinomycetota bacterium]|nr:hypothetical protein [Actinomycetota bacterium]